MKPIIEVQNLSKKYQINAQQQRYLSIRDTLSNVFSFNKKSEKEDFWALQDINFTVEAGESVGIIGRNGAGKSTLLKILSRITPPTKGQIILRGRVASLLEVGTGFHPELSGRENVYFNGSILGLKKSEIDKKFDEIVDFSGVEQFIDTPLKHYSSGMKLRLAFSVAAHLEPEILIIDEVLAVGDAEFQKKCLGKMDDVAKSGRTVLFVSHNMGAVQNLCKKSIFLEQGQVKIISTTHQVIQHYLNALSTMNTLDIGNRKDRQGSQIFKIEKISFFNKDNIEISQLILGEDTIIQFAYSNKFLKKEAIVFSIGVNTIENSFLFACRNDVANQTIEIMPKSGNFSCYIPKLPLRQGSYSFNIITYHKGDIVDWVQNAGIIIVENGDFYGTGKIAAENRAGVCINYTFFQ
jgi:lipopolysaccharide transport system ATP-binding protein